MHSQRPECQIVQRDSKGQAVCAGQDRDTPPVERKPWLRGPGTRGDLASSARRPFPNADTANMLLDEGPAPTRPALPWENPNVAARRTASPFLPPDGGFGNGCAGWIRRADPAGSAARLLAGPGAGRPRDPQRSGRQDLSRAVRG